MRCRENWFHAVAAALKLEAHHIKVSEACCELDISTALTALICAAAFLLSIIK